MIGNVVIKNTKNGDKMAFFTIEDRYGEIECLGFPKVYASYGHAIHPDPVGAMEDALKEIKRIEKEEGRHICVIGALCGTDIEPQDVADQARRLEEYGVILQPSNAKAALLAGLIVS